MPRVTLPNGSRMVVPRHGQPDARFLYAEIFEGRCYEQEGITLADSQVVLDVGANVGMFALRVAQVAPEARVFCFEPAPLTFACLVQNAAPHPNIELHECALAREPGVLAMTYFPRSPGNTTRHPELKLGEANAFAAHATLRWIFGFDKLGALLLALVYPLRRPLLRAQFRRVYTGGVPFVCRATTLDQVFAEQRFEVVDLLKIDVEGGERDVLAGLSDTNLARIRQLVVEVTPAYKASYLPELEGRLRDHGFTHVALRSMLPTGTPASDVFPCTVYATRTNAARSRVRDEAAIPCSELVGA
jgi:hypothetical protein